MLSHPKPGTVLFLLAALLVGPGLALAEESPAPAPSPSAPSSPPSAPSPAPSPSPRPGPGRPRIFRMAVEACKDKKEGEACSFETPRRGTISGTCKATPRHGLVCVNPELMRKRRPDNPPPDDEGGGEP